MFKEARVSVSIASKENIEQHAQMLGDSPEERTKVLAAVEGLRALLDVEESWKGLPGVSRWKNGKRFRKRFFRAFLGLVGVLRTLRPLKG